MLFYADDKCNSDNNHVSIRNYLPFVLLYYYEFIYYAVFKKQRHFNHGIKIYLKQESCYKIEKKEDTLKLITLTARSIVISTRILL